MDLTEFADAQDAVFERCKVPVAERGRHEACSRCLFAVACKQISVFVHRDDQKVISLLIGQGMNPDLTESALFDIGWARVWTIGIYQDVTNALRHGREFATTLEAINLLLERLDKGELLEAELLEAELAEEHGLDLSNLRVSLSTWAWVIRFYFMFPQDFLNDLGLKRRGRPSKKAIREYIQALMDIWERYTGKEPEASRDPYQEDHVSDFLDFAEVASLPVLGSAFNRRFAAQVVWDTKKLRG